MSSFGLMQSSRKPKQSRCTPWRKRRRTSCINLTSLLIGFEPIVTRFSLSLRHPHSRTSSHSQAQSLGNSIFGVILLGELDQRWFCSIFSEDLFCSNVLLRLSNFSSSSQSSRFLPPFSSPSLRKLRLRPKRPPL